MNIFVVLQMGEFGV